MSRRARRADSQSLDSLLDTMTNVVGILVLLLAVTQISVGEAVERIRSEEGLRVSEAERAEVERELGELRPRLASLERQVGERKLPKGVPAWLRDPARRGEGLAQTRRRVELLGDEIETMRGELARVELVLQDDEQEEPGAPRRVRLPDPRPPPQNARELFFYCQGERIVTADLAAIRAEIDRGWRNAIAAQPLEREPAPADFDRIVEYFQRVRPRAGPFVLSARTYGRDGLGVALERGEPESGEGTRALRDPGSAFQRALAAASPEQAFAHFYVWPDCFRTYLEARRLAEKRGFAVGWHPFQEKEPLAFVVAGRGVSIQVD